jgi:predicted phosphodiesterase
VKIQIMSDLHLEFHKDRGQSFIRGLNPDGVDVLVLAGDIDTVKTGLGNKLRMLCTIYPQVVFVLGNHEYYGSTREEVIEHMSQLKLDNFHWLHNNTATIAGQRFIGCTLWFRDDPGAVFHRGSMNDFKQIPKVGGWVYDENKESTEFLTLDSNSSDIVITHHLPSKRSVSPRFNRSDLNRFFVCELDDVIEHNQPKMWVHGHTHDSCDYKVGGTRVVCNPLGYTGIETNHNFNDNFIVEV